MVGCGKERNIMAPQPGNRPHTGNNEKNKKPLWIIGRQKLWNQYVLTWRIWIFFLLLLFLLSSVAALRRQVLTKISSFHLNLSIHIHHEIGRSRREHVYAAQYAGAPLSGSPFLFCTFFKCIRRQITLISGCYEADKRRNKAQTIRGEKSVTCRWTSRGGGVVIKSEICWEKKTNFCASDMDIKRCAQEEMTAENGEATVRDPPWRFQPHRQPPLFSIPTAMLDLWALNGNEWPAVEGRPLHKYINGDTALGGLRMKWDVGTGGVDFSSAALSEKLCFNRTGVKTTSQKSLTWEKYVL